MTYYKNSLRKKYEKIVAEYVKVFSEKHGIDLDFWVSDQIGTVACFGDYFFDFETIRLDIDYDIHQQHLFIWYEGSIKENSKTINYKTYLSKPIKQKNLKLLK